VDPEGRAPVIAIIGLGPVGRAIGLGLQAVKTRFEILGHDPDPEHTRAARDSGAVDRVHWDLASVAESADVVIFTTPLGATMHDLELIGPLVRPGALVTDTGPVKKPVLELADRVMRSDASFIGGHLVIQPDPELPAGALKGATWCVIPAAGADDGSIDVLTRLIRAVGADPFFIGADEHDALALGVGPLGYLMAAATLRLFAASPSLRDLRRLAPAEVGRLASAAGADTTFESLATADAALAGWLDALIGELAAARAAVLAGGDSWSEYRATIHAAHEAWLDALAREEADRSAAFDELEQTNVLRDSLFGRRRKR
jgi:prephenate dehydrogenase